MISLNLYELRKSRGITQSHLAEIIGVSFQTISKWETGLAIPDVKHVIAMARFFEVTTDQILGLQPIKYDYFSRMTESSEYWNEKLPYIKSSRIELWNLDYMEFLIKKVWKVKDRVDVLDFGCGNGYLAGLMMPFLLDGSTYTGIDVCDVMIQDAKSVYENSDYPTKFLCKNGYNYKVEEKYDIVICQAFLRELSNPKKAICNMITSLKKQGLIVCIEVDRELDNAGFYVDGMDYDLILDTEVQRKYWKAEYDRNDRDYAIGIRIPFLLKEFGIRDIEVRIQDKVRFVNPYQVDEYEKLQAAYISEKGWKEENAEEDKRAVEVFVNRGLSKEEAEKIITTRNQIRDKIMNEKRAFLKSTGFLITYGRKE